MAAAVLEALTIPRASSFLAATSFPPIASSSVFALSGGRSSVKLPESRGLRIQSTRFSGSVSLSASRLVRRVGRIVCEAPETAVVVKKGQIVRVDKEKYLNSINVLDLKIFETGEYALIAWVGVPTAPAWLPTEMLIKSDKLDYERI